MYFERIIKNVHFVATTVCCIYAVQRTFAQAHKYVLQRFIRHCRTFSSFKPPPEYEMNTGAKRAQPSERKYG